MTKTTKKKTIVLRKKVKPKMVIKKIPAARKIRRMRNIRFRRSAIT